MKKNLLTLLLTSVSALSFAQSSYPIDFKENQMIRKEGNADIHIYYPFATAGNAVADSINRRIFNTFNHFLPYDNKIVATSEKTLNLMLLDNAHRLRVLGETKSIDAFPYTHYSAYELFGNDSIVSVFLQQYFFAGGAHGMSDGVYLNVNPRSGQTIDIQSFVKDTATLMDLAAVAFCRQNHKPLDAMRLQTGLFMELSDIPIPSQMGLSGKGLVLYYQPYEIAPYSSGDISIIIPYNQLGDIVNEKLMKSVYSSKGYKSYNQKIKSVHRDDNRRAERRIKR
ncbi:MAG: DUF3298 domain-containing protein [Mucinivorans sp.]